MRKWEDIVKDKLEGYESNLPEDSLAAFNARRAAVGATKAKRFPLVWAIVPAIAAGLAAILLLKKPAVPEDGIQMIPQPVEVYSQVDDSLDTTPPFSAAPLIAQASRTNVVRPARETAQPAATTVVEENHIPEETRIPEETPVPETDDIGLEDTPEEPAINSRPVVQDSSPFVPQPSTEKPAVHFNPGTGGAIAAGGGLLAAMATQLAKPDVNGIVPGNFDIDGVNDAGETASHSMPLVVGLSVSYPVTEKIGITTGLEYSLYSSSFLFLAEEKTQLAHYLGIPVRLDWAFVSSRWLDAYWGAGVKGDLCLGATLDGEALGKDGPAFRLLGAGGIQFNATRHLCLFLEPEVSWTFPSERRVLSTYSSEHPWMFTVATGLRIDLGK